MADDWWTTLYNPHTPDTSSTRRPAPPRRTVTVGGGRLPPPGQVVDLDAPAESAAEPVPEDTVPEDTGEVHVHVTITQPNPDPAEQLGLWSRTWTTATSYIAPWKALMAVGASVAPIPVTGYSIATTWAYTVGELRGLHIGVAYAVGFGALALAGRRFHHTHGLLALTCTAVTSIGVLGAIDWYDPITALTGVTPS